MKNSIVVLAGLLLLGACSKKEETPKADSNAVRTELYQELKSVDKLVFATLSVTKTAKLEDSEWYKVGKRIAVYSYDSYLRAYIDMSDLRPEDIELNEEDNTVYILLPPIRTEVTGRDMTMNLEYENIGLLRSEIDSKERAAMKEQANRSFVTEVEKNPTFREHLTEAAERKARRYFETLFEESGYTATVDFK